MTAMRRCPSSRRCRVAARPSFQFADPIAGTSPVGSPVASITTHGNFLLVRYLQSRDWRLSTR